MSKLMQKARDLRCYMIIYMFFMTLMQVLAHLHKPIRWQILALFLTSVPSWIIYIKCGYADLMSEMFSLNGYDVYVNGASSESEERYYSGDYVPFVSEGEVTEVRTYDSDYAPMD